MSRLHVQHIFSLQLEWIRAADSKVPPVFAINISMLGVTAALIKSLDIWTISAALTAVSTMLLLSSVAMLAIVSFPRTDGPKSSNVFFDGIADQDGQKYVAALRSIAEEDLADDFARQAHRNAEIAAEKYKYLKLSFILMFLAKPFWLLSVYCLYG